MYTHQGSKLKSFITSFLMISYLIPLPLQAMDIPQDLNLLPSENQIALITSKDNETEQRILDYKDILKMQQVCKSWLQIASQADLWVLLAKQDGFKVHPNTAFQAHYNYVKGKKLIGEHILAISQVEIEHPIAQEMINCLNRSAPYMHFGAVSLLMDLMNSPQIPLELSCIQVPENMNLMIYPLMSEDEILQKADDEILQICSSYESDIIVKDSALKDKLLRIIEDKDLPFIADLFNKLIDFRKKMIDKNCSEENREAIFFEFRRKVLEAFVENKDSILERVNRAKQEEDITTLDLLIKYLSILCDSTDDSSSSDSSGSEEDIGECEVDPYLPVLEEANDLFDSLKNYIHTRVPLSQVAKMANYIDCLGTSIEDEYDKKGFGPIKDPSVRGIPCSNSDIRPFHTISKEEQSLLSLLRAGFVSPSILDNLQSGLSRWNDDSSWPLTTVKDDSFSEEFSIEKYEAYGQFLFRKLVLTYPALSFTGSNDCLGIDIINNTNKKFENEHPPIMSRKFLMNVHLSKISHGNFLNLWHIHFLLGNLERIHSCIPFLLADKSLHPEICQKLLGFNSFSEFQTDLSRIFLPKLLDLSANLGNLNLSFYEINIIQQDLGMMHLHLGNWEEGKKYFLQICETSSDPYDLFRLPPKNALEILDILDPHGDRGDNWPQVRRQVELERDWKEQQGRNDK